MCRPNDFPRSRKTDGIPGKGTLKRNSTKLHLVQIKEVRGLKVIIMLQWKTLVGIQLLRLVTRVRILAYTLVFLLPYFSLFFLSPSFLFLFLSLLFFLLPLFLFFPFSFFLSSLSLSLSLFFLRTKPVKYVKQAYETEFDNFRNGKGQILKRKIIASTYI